MNKRDFIESEGGKFRGKKELLKHLNGEPVSARQAIVAKCYECNGFYADGKADCKIPDCPLYPYMVYKEGGAIKHERKLTEAQKKAVTKRLKKARQSK